MVFGEPVLTAKKYATILPWTTEFQEDEEVGILPVIASEIAEAMALAENTEFISGATAGSLGILAVTGVTAHSLISGASFSNLTWDDLNTMIAKLANISASESMTAKFYFSPDVFMALTRTKAAGDGNYFVGYAPNGDTIYRAWGREVRIVNGMPALAASAGTTKFGFLADLSRHAFIGDRRGMTMDLLTEGTVKDSAGNDVNLALTDSKALRVTKRTAFVTALQTGIVTVATN
jgi:HK97 family phage major capsid protein